MARVVVGWNILVPKSTIHYLVKQSWLGFSTSKSFQNFNATNFKLSITGLHNLPTSFEVNSVLKRILKKSSQNCRQI